MRTPEKLKHGCHALEVTDGTAGRLRSNHVGDLPPGTGNDVMDET